LVSAVIDGEIDPQLADVSVEAWFHLQGYINTQNKCYWNSQNPYLTHKVPLHPVKVRVWCAVSAKRIVGPVFCNKTVVRYVQVVLGQFFPQLLREGPYSWLQQDTITAHTAVMSMQTLSDVFGDRIISSGIWPASSPRSYPYDFFFWNCLKDKVYNINLEELKENICRDIFKYSCRTALKGT
jgi:hypothetical protein